MRNRYLASFIIAIVVLAGAAALIALGFVQMAPRACSYDFGCFGRVQYSCVKGNTTLGMAFIVLGGALIISGVLLFILSEVIRSHEECCDCCDADFIDSANGCNCGCDCNCNCGEDCNCGCDSEESKCDCGCSCGSKEEK